MSQANAAAERWLDELKWDAQGLIPAIAQDADKGDVLMFAYMNRASLQQTLSSGYATYWSRSRGKLWRKGEESGHLQRVVEIRSDCDQDALLLKIEQVGGIACHTGRRSCFFYRLRNETGAEPGWQVVEPVLKNLEGNKP